MLRNPLILSVTSFLFVCSLRAEAPQGVAGPDVVPAEWEFLPQTVADEFDFHGYLELGSPDAVLELAFNWQGTKDFCLARVSRKNASIERVQHGVRIGIGARTGSPLTGEKTRLVLKRRRESVRLYLGKSLAAEAFDHTFSGGKLAVRAQGGTVRLTQARYQPVEEVVFSDDFMRSDAEGTWDPVSGQWSLRSLPNVSMSSNAFHLQGLAGDEPALYVAGAGFWDSYRIGASIRFVDDGPGGLVACVKEGGHYQLQWAGSKTGRLQLLRVEGDSTKVLASVRQPFIPGHWYRLSLTVNRGELRAAIDGREILRVHDGTLFEGKAGLFSGAKVGVHFDDVEVTNVRDLHETFEAPSNGLWTRLGGRWSRSATRFGGVIPGDSCLRVMARTEARMLLSYPVPPKYSFEADTFAPDGEFGLCFNYQDEQNYWVAKFSRHGAELSEIREGNVIAHGRNEKPFLPALRRIGVRNRENVVQISVDGRPCLSGAGTSMARGSVGLYAARATETSFDNVDLRFDAGLKPVYIQHQVFSGERTMANWAAAQSDWVAAQWGGAAAQWHRGDFPGDVRVSVRLARKTGGTANLKLCIAARDQSPDTGFVLDLALDATAELRIKQGAAALAERTGVSLPFPCTLDFSRRGDHLTAYVDGQPLLCSRIPASHRGTQIGWSSQGLELKGEDLQIFADNCRVYTFNASPVDWAPASGDWEITNRWTCDPRWSFFSGRSPKLAALWNKRPLRGDISVEFAAGPKMDSAKGGGSYAKYASDINVTLCGDGKDLTTGYNFVFGGWGNTVSRILRNNQPVAESRSAIIPTSGLHRRWLYFKARKQGSTVSLSVDNQEILSYEDPVPLPGDRMALWTWNNGIMVGRVRVSAGSLHPPALYQYQPETWQTCVYNHPGQPGPVQAQLTRLKSGDPAEMGAAAMALGQMREPSTIAALLPLLEHEEEDCRWQAADALARIGLPGVQALLGKLGTPEEKVRWKIEAALRKSGPEAVPLIAEALREGDETQRRSCAFILRDIPCAGTYEALAAALGDEDEDVRWKAADSLVKFGRPAVGSVVRTLRTESVKARQAAAWILHQIGERAPITPLLGALNDPDKDVRWKAAIALKEREPRPQREVAEAFKVAHNRPLEHLDWILSEWGVKAPKREPGAGAPHHVPPDSAGTAETASLAVESKPPGASAFLNDLFLGTTPGSFRVRAGAEQLLRLERSGYETSVQVIKPEKAASIKTELRPRSTLTLTITSAPAQAEVFLNDESRGRTPLTIKGVTSGRHALRLEREGCLPAHKSLSLAPNKDETLRLSLVFKAEQYYLSSLKKDPLNASFRTELAHVYFLRNAYDLATAQLLEAFRLVHTGKDTSGYAGRLQQEVQKTMTAFYDYGDQTSITEGRNALEKIFSKLTGEFPTNAYCWTTLASLQQQRGDLPQAIETLTRGTKHITNDWQVFYSLGVAQYTLAQQGRKGLKAASLTSLQKALQLAQHPKHRAAVQQHINAASKLPN